MYDRESDTAQDGSRVHGRRDRLVEQAVSAMVHQFARPLEFLRELVQNALDAGSPKVAVIVDRTSTDDHDVVAVEVRDWGRGMDERVIDQELTCLFASAKDRDLAAIGRFGIGFTSVFAIAPEAVMVRTGCRDEAWELLFHPDRSYDKVRLEEPVVGTSVKVFKAMPPGRVAGFVDECRYTLRFWCEHVTVPMTLEDRCGDVVSGAASPFAAFGGEGEAASVERERIDRPLHLECPVFVEHTAGNVRVAMGYGDTPAYAFYRGGLTLVRSGSQEVLGDYAARASHYVLKVDSTALEHTLTRDSVRHDRSFDLAMEVALGARPALIGALLDALEQAIEAGDETHRLQGWLAGELDRGGLGLVEDLATRRILVDVHGRPVTLQQVDRQAGLLGAVLVSDPRDDVDLLEWLADLGITVLADLDAQRAVVGACPRLSLLLRVVGRWVDLDAALGRRRIEPVTAWYRLAEACEATPLEAELFAAAQARLRAAGLDVTLVPCSSAVDGGQLCVEVPEGLGLFRTSRRGARLGRRYVAVDPRHPHLRSLLGFATDRLDLAAVALAQAVALSVNLGGPRRLARLVAGGGRS